MQVDILESKSFNEYIQDANNKPIPKMLFSEFWFESELCILFADTNTGKSILATQIGDSISKGIPIDGFKLEAHKQRVLYFDFEMSDVQLKKRYSDGDTQYIFSDNLIRVQFNPDTYLVDDKALLEAIENIITKNNSSTIIIDNITYLIQDSEKSKFAMELMKALKHLKNKYNLSILVLAHTPKREFNKPISNNDLQGSRMIMNFCDSAFVIGRSYADTNIRYIKQIKQRNCEQIYHTENVCICEISKAENSMLRFVYLSSGSEWEHLNTERVINRQEEVNNIKGMRAQNMTYKEIGDILGMSADNARMKLSRAEQN